MSALNPGRDPVREAREAYHAALTNHGHDSAEALVARHFLDEAIRRATRAVTGSRAV